MNDRKPSQSTPTSADPTADASSSEELPVFPDVSSSSPTDSAPAAEPTNNDRATTTDSDSIADSSESDEPPPLPKSAGLLGASTETPTPPPPPTDSPSPDAETASEKSPLPPPPPPIPGESVETMPGPPPAIDEPPPLADGATRMLESEPTTLDLFLEQAMPILAIERGINSRSRVKMEALAQSLGLPEEQFEEAMGSLQGSGSSETNPQAEAYRLSLRNQLPKLPQNILTPALESRAIEIGVQRYGLSADEARQVIVEVCSSEKVQRISSEKAEQHIRALVKQKMGEAAWIDDASRKRLQAAGSEWGISAAEVDRIIKQYSNANRSSQKKTSRIAIYSISGACAVIVGLILFVIVINNSGNGTDSPPPEDDVVEVTDGSGVITTDGVADADVEVAIPPKWWNTAMAIARGRFLSAVDEDSAVTSENLERVVEINRVVSADPAERKAGYRGVVRLVGRTGVPAERRRAAAQMLALAYVFEPDEKAAQDLLDTLWSQLPSGSRRAPTAGAYEQAFWVAAIIATAATHEELPPERETQLAAGASRHFGAALVPGDDFITMESQLNLALSQVLYRQLANVATLGGKGLTSASFALADATTNRLNHDPVAMQELARLRSRLTAASLKGYAKDWKDFEEAAEAAIASGDAANVVALLEVYESTEVDELRQFLGQKLVARSATEREARGTPRRESAVDAANIEQVASYVRESFGIVKPAQPKTAGQRWRKLEPFADQMIASRLEPPAGNTNLLQAIAEAARLNMLACALAQDETGFVRFDEEIEIEAPNVAEALSGTGKTDLFVPGERPAQISESRRQRIVEATQNLGRYQSLAHATSISELRRVGEAYEQMKHLTAEQGRRVATFLVGPKTDEEHKDVLEVARDAARYTQVKLALVDAVEDKRWPAERFADVINRILQTEIDPADGDWRQQVQGALLADVLKTSSPDQQSDAKTLASLGAARDAYLQFYRDQAGLLGIPPALLRKMTTTGELLRALIDRRSSGLVSAAKSADDKQFAAELPELLELTDYIGSNDLGRTAYLQRLWLRVLAIRVKSQNVAKATAAQSIVDALDQQDKSTNTVLKQLRAGEIALLRLWMLHENL